jgi:hypothetical protein
MTRAYDVTWGVTIDAESPQEAAQIAHEAQQDPANIAATYLVTDEDGVELVVNL